MWFLISHIVPWNPQTGKCFASAFHCNTGLPEISHNTQGACHLGCSIVQDLDSIFSFTKEFASKNHFFVTINLAELQHQRSCHCVFLPNSMSGVEYQITGTSRFLNEFQQLLLFAPECSFCSWAITLSHSFLLLLMRNLAIHCELISANSKIVSNWSCLIFVLMSNCTSLLTNKIWKCPNGGHFLLPLGHRDSFHSLSLQKLSQNIFLIFSCFFILKMFFCFILWLLKGHWNALCVSVQCSHSF